MTIATKPYNLLLYFGIFLLLASFVPLGQIAEQKLFDREMMETLQPFLSFAGAVLMVLWIIYKLTARFLYSQTLTWTHVIVSLLTAITFIVLTTRSFESSSGVVSISFSSPVILLVLGPLVYFTNLILGISRK